VIDRSELADVTEGEDSAMATLHFANGARGLFYASNCHHRLPLLLEIHCEHGTLQINDNTLWRISHGERIALASDASPDGSSKHYWEWATSRQSAAFIMRSITRKMRITPISAPPENHSTLWRLFIVHLRYDNGLI
jgi:predicted dehydrogenase